MMTGRFDEAAAVAEQALADGQSAHTETAFQMYGVVQLELANAAAGSRRSSRCCSRWSSSTR